MPSFPSQPLLPITLVSYSSFPFRFILFFHSIHSPTFFISQHLFFQSFSPVFFHSITTIKSLPQYFTLPNVIHSITPQPSRSACPLTTPAHQFTSKYHFPHFHFSPLHSFLVSTPYASFSTSHPHNFSHSRSSNLQTKTWSAYWLVSCHLFNTTLTPLIQSS